VRQHAVFCGVSLVCCIVCTVCVCVCVCELMPVNCWNIRVLFNGADAEPWQDGHHITDVEHIKTHSNEQSSQSELRTTHTHTFHSHRTPALFTRCESKGFSWELFRRIERIAFCCACVCVCVCLNIYIGIDKMFHVSERVSSAQQDCVYLVKNTVK